jgi:hypothetical protein
MLLLESAGERVTDFADGVLHAKVLHDDRAALGVDHQSKMEFIQ